VDNWKALGRLDRYNNYLFLFTCTGRLGIQPTSGGVFGVNGLRSKVNMGHFLGETRQEEGYGVFPFLSFLYILLCCVIPGFTAC
jgi:hypothetical protein